MRSAERRAAQRSRATRMRLPLAAYERTRLLWSTTTLLLHVPLLDPTTTHLRSGLARRACRLPHAAILDTSLLHDTSLLYSTAVYHN